MSEVKKSVLQFRTCANNVYKVVSTFVFVSLGFLFFVEYFYFSGEDVVTPENKPINPTQKT